MKLLLFLASGISYETGLPSVTRITDEVLYGAWRAHTDSNFYHDPVSRGKQAAVIRLQKFLIHLKKATDAYMQKRRAAEATYEDLFYLVRQIEDETNGEIDNPLVEASVDRIRTQVVELCKPLRPIEEEYGLARLSSDACDFIECVVWKLLSTDKEPKGFELLKQLAMHRSVTAIDICTLNHDLLVESFLAESRIAYLDGFSAPDGEVRWFCPSVYEANTRKVTIQKLHGSIDWWYLERNGRRNFAIVPKGTLPWYCKDDCGTRLSEIYPRPRFLTGSYNKITEYRHGIFAELHNRFFRLLRERDFIVMSGYGWNDRGINGWLSEWLASSPKKRIVLLHRDPESLKKSKSNLWWRFDELVQRKQLVLIRKWFSEANAIEVLQACREKAGGGKSA